MGSTPNQDIVENCRLVSIVVVPYNTNRDKALVPLHANHSTNQITKKTESNLDRKSLQSASQN